MSQPVNLDRIDALRNTLIIHPAGRSAIDNLGKVACQTSRVGLSAQTVYPNGMSLIAKFPPIVSDPGIGRVGRQMQQ